jgi:hypothetical protein
MATWDDVRRLALELPETVESTSWHQPCFKVAGKTFLNLSPSQPGALVVRVEVEEKPLMIASRPDLYWETPHYANYPALLVRLDAIDEAELRERVIDSWLWKAPKRLVKQLQTSSSDSV